jgi:diguanylate cyclase (GGDEF)-like protein/PAS domain S-box-containing protein
MSAHIPTLFMVIIAAGATLAAAMAVVAWGRDRNILLWAAALALHTCAYTLFSLRGQINDVASIVLGNMCLSSALAMFAEGLYRFQQRPCPRWLVWTPVAVVGVGFYVLLNDQSARIVFGGTVFSVQALIVLAALATRYRETTGRGQYILALGGSLVLVAFVARVLATVSGQTEMLTLTTANPVQTATFLISIVCLMLLAIGLLIMTKERAEMESHRTEKFERVRSHAMELLAKDAPLPHILDALVRGLEDISPRTLCSILLLDSTGRTLTKGASPSLPDFYNSAIEGISIGQSVGSCGTAAFTGERVVVTDIATHPFWAPYRDLAAQAGLGACWSQPILDAAGKVLGTFAIYHRVPTTPAADDIHFIEQFAGLASIAIERSKAAAIIRASVAHYRLLTEGVTDVVWKLDTNFYFTYMSPADEHMRGFHASEVIGHHVFELFPPQGVTSVKQQLRRRDLAEQSGEIQDSITFEVQQLCKDGSLVWTEIISNRERDANGNIVGHHGITRNISERKRAQEEVHQLAFYDTLTRLANRALLTDRMHQTMAAGKRSGCYSAVMFLDLDNFKPLNDQHGHRVGDLLLIEVAKRLCACVRQADTVARFGGDEFVVMLGELDVDKARATALAEVVAEKIRAALSSPYVLAVADEGASAIVEHQCSASIGVVVFASEGTTSDEALKWADQAMYRAKEAGRNTVRFCGAPAPTTAAVA